MALHLRANGEAMVTQVELKESETLDLINNSPSLSKFLEWLDKLGKRPTLKNLEKRLLELNIDLENLSKYLGYTDDEYQRNVVKKTENYELVLICWKPGQKTPIHDHKGSDCAFLILEGVSTESIYRKQDGGLMKTEVRKYVPGQVCAADEPDIHKISNDEDINLVNLHLYTPPLKGFNIYEG
jgi:cysteine dioxygenase